MGLYGEAFRSRCLEGFICLKYLRDLRLGWWGLPKPVPVSWRQVLLVMNTSLPIVRGPSLRGANGRAHTSSCPMCPGHMEEGRGSPVVQQGLPRHLHNHDGAHLRLHISCLLNGEAHKFQGMIMALASRGVCHSVCMCGCGLRYGGHAACLAAGLAPYRGS